MARGKPDHGAQVFGGRAFAIAALMICAGSGALRSTTLLPFFLQELLGYTDQLSGMVLSPRELAILVMMPLVGTLIRNVEAVGWPDRLRGFSNNTVPHARFESENPLQNPHDVSHLPIDRPSLSIHPINTAAFAPATGENSNQIFEHGEPLPQYRRDRLDGDNPDGAPHTSASGRACQARHQYDAALRGVLDGLSANPTQRGLSAGCHT